MTRISRIVIAGTHSGCGKTTIASGLMAALTECGLKVQPFRPDRILSILPTIRLPAAGSPVTLIPS